MRQMNNIRRHGLVKAYDVDGVLQNLGDNGGVYHSKGERTMLLDLWRGKIPGGHFDIVIRGSRWCQAAVIPDFKKKIIRPEAKYDNKSW